MTFAVVEGMPAEEYFSAAAVSNSHLKAAAKSPWHYRMVTDPEIEKPAKGETPQQFTGILLHCALLEPEDFPHRYPVGPDVAKNSRSWKMFAETLEHWQRPISGEQAQRALLQAQSLRREINVAEIFSLPGMNEVSVFWKDGATGLDCKARPDRVVRTDAGAILFDAKTTTDASREGFARTVANYAYHRQAAWYARGWQAATGETVCGMVFGVVETDFPYAAAAYMVDEAAVAAADAECSRLLSVLAECERNRVWPGYPDGMGAPLALPFWAMRQIEAAGEDIYA